MPYVSDRIFSKLYENDYLLKLNNISTQENDSPELMRGKFREYDIIHNNVKYEIKTCRYCIRTHNVCIEFEFKKMPSGIETTTSDYYIYYVVDQTKTNINIYEYYYEIPTSFIKELIINQQWRKIQNGGDGYKSRFYLFDENLFNEFKRN